MVLKVRVIHHVLLKQVWWFPVKAPETARTLYFGRDIPRGDLEFPFLAPRPGCQTSEVRSHPILGRRAVGVTNPMPVPARCMWFWGVCTLTESSG